MKDDAQFLGQTSTTGMGADEVRLLAGRAISVLAAKGANRNVALDRKMDTLCDAFLTVDEDRRHDMLMQLRHDGVRGRDIIDHVIPAIARLLGDRWFADDISFAHVTIGTARLQETVRALASRARYGHRRPDLRGDTPTVLLVLPKGEEHSLGVFVLADQISRQGYGVHVVIDQTANEIAKLVRNQAFCMVGISVSGRRMLASVADLVKKITSVTTRVTPIVIGGSVLDQDVDALGATGADHIARDALGALRACGLSDVWMGATQLGSDGQAAGDRSDPARVGA